MIIGPLSARSCARLYGSAAAAQCAGDRAAAAIFGGAWWTWLAVTGVAGLVVGVVEGRRLPFGHGRSVAVVLVTLFAPWALAAYGQSRRAPKPISPPARYRANQRGSVSAPERCPLLPGHEPWLASYLGVARVGVFGVRADDTSCRTLRSAPLRRRQLQADLGLPQSLAGVSGQGGRPARLGLVVSAEAGGRTGIGADKMLFMVAAMAAEMERDLIRERTLDGLRAAQAQGRRGGRPTAVDDDVLAVARARQARGESVTAIARHLGIGRSTLYRALQSPDDARSPLAAPFSG